MERLTSEDYATALQNGIDQKKAYYRFYHLYWSKEEAITLSSRRLWTKYAEKCKANGVSRNSFYYRIREQNMDPEEASTLPTKKRGGNNRKNSLFSKEIMDHAKTIGVNYSTLYNRVHHYGWDLKRAFTEPTTGRGRKKK